MDRIVSGLFPCPMLDADTFSDNIGQSISPSLVGVKMTKSGMGEDVLKTNSGVDSQTLKVHSSCKSGRGARNSGIRNIKDNHKLFERQRRRDMKHSYSLLRFLLPEEYIMGKRSIEEQLSETANYIKHLQEKVKELKQIKEGMRNEKLLDGMLISVQSDTLPTVKINSVGEGILVSVNTFQYQTLLSDLLIALVNNGLDIISATTSSLNDRVFHTIHAKVSDLQGFDSRILYETVVNLVNANTV